MCTCEEEAAPHRHVRGIDVREFTITAASVSDRAAGPFLRGKTPRSERAAYERRAEIRGVLHLVGGVPFGIVPKE